MVSLCLGFAKHPLSLKIHNSVHPPVHLSIPPSMPLPVRLSIHPTVHLVTHPHIYLSNHLSSQLAIHSASVYWVLMVARPCWAESVLGRCRAGDEQTWAEVCFSPCWAPAHDGHRLAPAVSWLPGCPILLGRQPSPLGLGNCS